MTIDEVWEIIKCCLSMSKGGLSAEQIDYLLQDRQRAEYFENAMKAWRKECRKPSMI